MSTVVTITASGPVGSGKSALLKIEIALKALGVSVRYADEVGAQLEKRMTHSDWATYLEMYQPQVVLAETIDHAAISDT